MMGEGVRESKELKEDSRLREASLWDILCEQQDNSVINHENQCM